MAKASMSASHLPSAQQESDHSDCSYTCRTGRAPVTRYSSTPDLFVGPTRWLVSAQEAGTMALKRGGQDRGPRLPPTWFVHLAWRAHRGLYRLSRGHLGLWRPKGRRWGTLQLTATGRRSGQPRSVILGYFEDGPNLVTLAMNGWADGEPSWWLNLREHPVATVHLASGARTVRARAAEGDERARLWARWREIDTQLDAYAALRSTETAVVVLEPVPTAT